MPNFFFCASIAASIHFLRPLSAQFSRAFSNLSISAPIVAISAGESMAKHLFALFIRPKLASISQKLPSQREGNYYT
jgi:hypothetical protein